MSINKIILTGRLTKDPELKFTQGKGTALVNFDIAVNDGFGDNKKVYYIPVVVWGKTAEAVANYCTKGSLIGVNGKLTTRSYEAKDGGKRYVTEVVTDLVNGIEFLENKKQSKDIPSDYFGKQGIEVTEIDEDCPF